MSKVGSTSLLNSLQFTYLKLGLPEVQLYHVHTLTQLDLVEQIVKDSNGTPEQFAVVREYKSIRRDFETDPADHWTAITIVRDPIARHISDFFHHIDRHVPDWHRRWRDRSLSIEEVLERFLASSDHAYFWFEAEIQAVLGIDVYSRPFPDAGGFSLFIRQPKVTLLLLRLEDMDRVAAVAIKKLLGIENFKLHSFNSGREGDSWELYKAFKRTALPEWYVEKAYGSRLAKHFYSNEEREAFSRRWTTGSPESQKTDR